ncbi:MAG: bifunctional UDP-sugar hydrolase/5'-nucleotidase, partial [Desulfatiglandales bacterium]
MRRLAVVLVFLSIIGCTSVAIHSSTSVAIHSSTSVDKTATLHRIIILYTSDEHGCMEATKNTGGAAGLMGLWRKEEGYNKDGPFLILSGGDMWTGPAISTWFRGESMASVMNLMGYHAAAIGNHEFDFGIERLVKQKKQSKFPFLSANIRDKETNLTAAIATPYVVEDVNGVKVGLIGLTTIDTPQTTKAENVSAFNFIPYKEALERIVPKVKGDGAELLVVVGHICADEMRALATTAANLGIAVIGGGHCHELLGIVVNKIALIQGGGCMEAYAKVDLLFDTATDVVVNIKPSTHENTGGKPDSEIAAVVSHWRARTDESLSHVIGYLEKEIDRHSDAMFNMVTDAWLAAYPGADVSLTNRGGFRQSIPAGEISLATIIGVLPFDNTLVDAELTGAQLIENIKLCQPVVGGMTTIGGYKLADGTPIDPAATYHVLVNDFIYAGGDGCKFKEHDPDAYNTSINWRQPVKDWIPSLKTSPDTPLDSRGKAGPRQK